MRRKMDADLMRLVFGETGAQEELLPAPHYGKARKHLRALLAVVRAAERIADLASACSQNGGQVCGAEWALIAKVGRLRRLSRPQRAGRGR